MDSKESLSILWPCDHLHQWWTKIKLMLRRFRYAIALCAVGRERGRPEISHSWLVGNGRRAGVKCNVLMLCWKCCTMWCEHKQNTVCFNGEEPRSALPAARGVNNWAQTLSVSTSSEQQHTPQLYHLTQMTEEKGALRSERCNNERMSRKWKRIFFLI